MITGIDHIVLNVSDAEASVAWYGEMFGLRPERLDQWRAGQVPFVSLRVSDSVLIDLLETDITGTNMDHVALVTDRETFDRFVADHGSLIEMGPKSLFGARGQGDGAYLRDPDGHRVELRTYG